MTPNEQVLGFIRTYVPYGIGAAVAWLLLTFGLDLSGDVQILAVTLAVALVTNVYYLGIRLIESRWPWLGVFLGWPKQPEYVKVDNLWASLVRTLIPVLVAFLVSTLALYIAVWAGVEISVESQAGLITIIVALVEAGYYALARGITARWPWTSFLLGTPTVDVNQSAVKAITPTYTPEPPTVKATGVETGAST